MTGLYRTLLLLIASTMLTACSSNLKRGNEVLRQEIEERRGALADHQQASLEDAQAELVITDSLLEESRRQYDEMYTWVMEHSEELTEQSAEVSRLAYLRTRRDSLKIQFDVLCEKIKYIRKKQKE